MAKKSKSKSKLKLPKEVAGVKVPKGLRKQAKTLLEIIDSPAGRELAAAGLTLAATSLVAKASDSKTKGAVKTIAREAVARRRTSDGDAADLGAVLSAAVAEGARRFLQGFEEGKKAASSENRSEMASEEPPEAAAPASRRSSRGTIRDPANRSG